MLVRMYDSNSMLETLPIYQGTNSMIQCQGGLLQKDHNSKNTHFSCYARSCASAVSELCSFCDNPYEQVLILWEIHRKAGYNIPLMMTTSLSASFSVNSRDTISSGWIINWISSCTQPVRITPPPNLMLAKSAYQNRQTIITNQPKRSNRHHRPIEMIQWSSPTDYQRANIITDAIKPTIYGAVF